MQDLDDLALLREYATNNSEAAYAELVARRIGFVYSTARRQVRDPLMAEEITQAVFIILAQKAGKISDKTILAGWLFKTTRYVAIAQTREIMKRSLRTATIEKEFQMQTELQSAATDPLWEQMSPLLDEALAALGETDRQAVLLRFFENKSLAEVGNFLGIGEDTARKRISRALEKLHRYFNKRGVSSTTAIIAGAISTNSVQAAPMGLAKMISTVAVAKGATASTSTLTLIKGALKIMAWQKVKTALTIGTIVILAAGMTALAVQHKSQQSQHSQKIPYKVADDFWQLVNNGIDTNKLEIGMTRIPVNQNVHITIQSAIKGPIPVQINTNGEVVDFPHDEVLRRENPVVTIVPPLHGSCVALEPIPENLTFRYDQISDGVAEANNITAKLKSIIMKPSVIGWMDYLGYLFSSSKKWKSDGVIFRFPKSSASKAIVKIISIDGTKEYKADFNGQIKLKLDQKLITENPQVELSEKPQFIFIAPNS